MSKRLDKLTAKIKTLDALLLGRSRTSLFGVPVPAVKGVYPRIEELEETAQKVDTIRDELYGRGEHRSDDYWTIIQEPKPGLVKDVAELTERVKTLTGIVEQLAALHGKEIADFKPTTSEYGRILVDTKETDSDRPTQ